MSITADQLADLQADAAIGDDEAVFTDEELERIWERVGGASDETTQHNAALALIYRQLLANATKLHDWKAGASEEELSQVYEHLKDMYAMYAPSLDEALSLSTQFTVSSWKAQAHQTRTFPPDNAGDEWNSSNRRYPRV